MPIWKSISVRATAVVAICFACSTSGDPSAPALDGGTTAGTSGADSAVGSQADAGSEPMGTGGAAIGGAGGTGADAGTAGDVGSGGTGGVGDGGVGGAEDDLDGGSDPDGGVDTSEDPLDADIGDLPDGEADADADTDAQVDAGLDAAECSLPTDCPATSSECQTRTCDVGHCGIDLASPGAACSSGGVMCNTNGDCVAEPTLVEVSSDTDPVASAGTAMITVALDAPAPVGGVSVTLSLDNPSAGSIPANALIPQGALEAQVQYQDNGSASSVTISAAYDGVTVYATLNIATIAVLMLNELNPNVSGSADLVELRVVSGGSVEGMRLEQQVATATTLATLPTLVVAGSDIIVIHLNPGASIATETTVKSACTDAGCYANAWDVRGGTTGLTYSNQVLSIVRSNGTRMDSVPFVRNTSSTGAFPADLQTIQGQGLWLPVNCGGSPCTYASAPTAIAVSALWDSVGSTPTSNSVRRSTTTDTNTAADWSVGAHSFGAP